MSTKQTQEAYGRPIEAGGPAFPCEWDYINSNRAPANGMTLRDYFAAKALPALIVDGQAVEGIKKAAKASGQDGMKVTAQVAYAYADAMLKARETE